MSARKVIIGATEYQLRTSDYGPYVVTSRGNRVSASNLASLFDAAKAANWGTLKLAQGGLSKTVPDSAKTHWGLGATDIQVDGRPKELVWEFCRQLQRRGHCPFPRGFGGDPWGDERHIHDLFTADSMHGSAAAQVADYHLGKNGLVNNGAYVGPGVSGFRPYVFEVRA